MKEASKKGNKFTFPKVAENDMNALKSFRNTLHVAVTTIASLYFYHDLAAMDNVRRATNTEI